MSRKIITPIKEPLYYTVSDAAKLLGLPYWALRKAIKNGEIVRVVPPGYKKPRIPLREINRIIREASDEPVERFSLPARRALRKLEEGAE